MLAGADRELLRGSFERFYRAKRNLHCADFVRALIVNTGAQPTIALWRIQFEMKLHTRAFEDRVHIWLDVQLDQLIFATDDISVAVVDN